MNKKGQGISLNTIIIAIIALVVLVLLVAIFTGKMGEWVKGVSSTQEDIQQCACRVNNEDVVRKCFASNPGEDWNEYNVPTGCERFSDCFNKCYEIDAQSYNSQ